MDELFIANKIKYIRQYLALTQSELGKIIGATKQCVSSWERGKNIPDSLTFCKILNIAGLPLNELLKEMNQKDNQNKFILSPDEQKLIAKLRTYPLEKRNALNTFLGIYDKN